MNLYGFAAGDPVNFSDPFGLCADSLHDKNGRCPGGLTDRQYDRVEYAAQNRMTEEARDLVLDLLHRGKISAATFDEIDGMAGKTNVVTKRMRILEDAFNYKIGDLAFLLAHEAKHTQQGIFIPWNREGDADAFACSNTWGRQGYRSGAYRFSQGPCGSGR